MCRRKHLHFYHGRMKTKLTALVPMAEAQAEMVTKVQALAKAGVVVD